MDGLELSREADVELASHGEGRDRPIERRGRWPWKLGLAAIAVAVAGWLALTFLRGSSAGSLRLSRQAIVVATAENKVLEESIPVSGTLLPRSIVFLDLSQQGRVEEVLARSGTRVERGQPLVKLSNSDLEIRAIQADAQRLEQLNALRDSRFRMRQATLDRERELVELDYQIQRLERRLERNRQLLDKEVISRQEYDEVHDELDYYRNRRTLSLEASRQDTARMEQEIRQLEASAEAMVASYDVIQRSLESLLVKAPVAGLLTSLDAEIGQLKPSGARLGQIDVLDDGFKVRAELDEYYASRIQPGQSAISQPLDGETFELAVTKIYPEVSDGHFDVDFEFAAGVPEGLRRGQALGLQLKVGSPAPALVIPRGAFFEKTGGRWIFVLEERDLAVRRDIRLGRQSSGAFEVLEGLREGERVVVSSYETFGNAQRLVLE